MKLYSLHDLIARSFYSPFTATNDGAACRSVATACIMDNTIVSQHPHDFELFRLGSFDEATGSVTMETAPVPLALCSELKEKLQSALKS